MTTPRHFFLSSAITQNTKGDSALEGDSVDGAIKGITLTMHSWCWCSKDDWGGRESLQQLTILDVSHLPSDPWGPEPS